ncbi:hypothetical protein D3C75_1325890 [compost metagenome]
MTLIRHVPATDGNLILIRPAGRSLGTITGGVALSRDHLQASFELGLQGVYTAGVEQVARDQGTACLTLVRR